MIDYRISVLEWLEGGGVRGPSSCAPARRRDDPDSANRRSAPCVRRARYAQNRAAPEPDGNETKETMPDATTERPARQTGSALLEHDRT